MSEPPSGQPDAIDARAMALLARAYELAAMPLDGIEEPAQELARMTDDDLNVIDRARRITAQRLAARPDDATKQVASLIRRAIDVGMWRWRFDESRPPGESARGGATRPGGAGAGG